MERVPTRGRSGAARSERRRDAALIVATALLWFAIWFDVTPLLRGPAPYPPEWRWPYLAGKSVALTLGVPLAGAALLSVLAMSGSLRARRNPRRAAPAILLAASLLGPAMQLTLFDEARPTPILEGLAQLTMRPSFTGHYTLGVSDLARDPIAFLRQYPELIPVIHRRLPPHPATNPPGSSLFYRAVLAVCEASPSLSWAALSLTVGRDSELARSPQAARSTKRAAAVIAPLLLILLSATTCWPIAMLCRAFGSAPLAAARAGLLWALLPGPVLMIPELDQLIAALVAWTAGLLGTALVRAPGWPLRALLAGVAAFAAGFLSYGAAAFVCVAAALCSGLLDLERRQLVHGLCVVGLAALAGFAVLGGAVALGYRPIDAFRASMEIHMGSYTLARSYSTWLLFGPWDLAIFVGFPVALLLGSRVSGAVVALLREGLKPLQDPAVRGRLALAAALVALFLTGILRGEVGRSGMPLMSLCLVAAVVPSSVGFHDALPGSAKAGLDAHLGLLMATLLLVTCWVLRVSWGVP